MSWLKKKLPAVEKIVKVRYHIINELLTNMLRVCAI